MTIVWWVVNAVAFLVIIPAVATLAAKILKQLVETGRYAQDIAEHGGRVAANLEPVSALENTRRLATDVRTAAVGYADALDRA